MPEEPPIRYDRRFARVFFWYTRRLFAKSFHAVRLAAESAGIARSMDDRTGPLIVAMNHAGWWDPLLGCLLHDRFAPSRPPCAPMEADQLRTFAFFRRLGVFGIEPDDAASLARMETLLADFFAREPRAVFWITPQGRFTDVREEVRPRPGAAAVAARTPGVRVLCVAAEWSFWNDKRPEVFVRFDEAEPRKEGSPSTPAWQRALMESMGRNAAALAQLVRARDPNAFETLVGGDAAIHPVYDAWLRLRGRRPRIETRRAGEQGGAAPGLGGSA